MIYDDAHAELMAEGKVKIERVSHVEPAANGGWEATMNDGTVLGPFELRKDALDAEIKYLEQKLFQVK